MTKRNAAFVAFVAILAFFVGSVEGSPSLRDTLESLWTRHMDAYRSGDVARISTTMSAYRYGAMKNAFASKGRQLTPDLFSRLARLYPELSETRFVTLLEKGRTAGLVYVQDAKEADDPGSRASTFL